MHHEPLRPVGTTILDLDLADVGPHEVAGLRALLADHGVLVMPGHDALDDTAFAAFLRRFGDLVFTVGETPLAGFPDLNVISNLGRTTPPRSQFHVDTSYVSRPPAYTALRAVTIPDAGGETLFTNQYDAYESLPAAARRDLRDRTVTHVVTGVDPGTAQERRAEHPLFRPHPISGRIALYLSTPERCVAVSGMSTQESRETIAMLLEHSTRPDNVLRHAWSPGDVVMWDNGAVMHRADHSGVLGDRVMHRGMVAALG